MPSVRVLGNKLSEETKETVAKALCSDLKRILGVPIGETYFQEFDKFYVEKDTFTVHDGTENDSGCVTLIVNGPDREPSKLQELCETLARDFQNASGMPGCEVIFVYHPIDGNHIGSNGLLHSLRQKNNRQ